MEAGAVIALQLGDVTTRRRDASGIVPGEEGPKQPTPPCRSRALKRESCWFSLATSNLDGASAIEFEIQAAKQE